MQTHSETTPACQIAVVKYKQPRASKLQRLFTMMYSLNLILLWSFALSGSKAFAMKKLGIHNPVEKSLSVTRTKTSALNAIPRMLAAYPLIAESVAAGTMSCLGDALAQRKEKASYDVVRTSHFLFKGLGEGIMWSFWYRMVEHWSKLIARTILSPFNDLQAFETALKISVCIVLDLLVACPIIYSLWDIPVPALLRGERNVLQQVRAKLAEMLFASCKVWLPVNFVVYNMPVEYRVYLSSTADVFWQSIVSSISSRPLISDGPMRKTA